MTSIRNSLIAVLAFTVAAALIVASAFAADGDNGNSRRRGDNGKLKTGAFQIVVPKADRGGSGSQVVKLLPPSISPKANRAGLGPTAQFVAPKADRGNSSGPRTPTTLFSVSPKAPRAGDGPLAGNGPVTAKFVAPKASRGDGPVLAKIEEPRLAAPQLLAPASGTTAVKVTQGTSAPAPIETKAPVTVVASESPAPTAAVVSTSDHEVALAYVRAAQRYGYGDYDAADQGMMKAITIVTPAAVTKTIAAIKLIAGA